MFICSLVGASFVLVEEERSNMQAAVLAGPWYPSFFRDLPRTRNMAKWSRYSRMRSSFGHNSTCRQARDPFPPQPHDATGGHTLRLSSLVLSFFDDVTTTVVITPD